MAESPLAAAASGVAHIAGAVHIDAIAHRLPAGAVATGCDRRFVRVNRPPVSRSQIIVRRGTRYYLNEPRVNSHSAIKSLDKVRRIVLKAAGQLSETDILGS